jgi:hypothetical protein
MRHKLSNLGEGEHFSNPLFKFYEVIECDGDLIFLVKMSFIYFFVAI